MYFKDKYTNQNLKTKDPNKEKDKTELSVDAYALGELLDKLNVLLDKARRPK